MLPAGNPALAASPFEVGLGEAAMRRQCFSKPLASLATLIGVH